MLTKRWHHRFGRSANSPNALEVEQVLTVPSQMRGRRPDRQMAQDPGGYQPQLDGVRAIAVLAIIVFHARTSWLPGGFIGVDVFFVLSGFLITRILQREMATKGSISFKDFYIRRALRLFPALAVACAIIAILNWILVTLPERSATLVGTIGALTYSSTWLMAFNVVDLGDMVPTWSLAVEEHFYVIWPVLALLVLRGPRRLPAMLILTSVAAAYTFIIPAVFGWNEGRSYYAPDTRAVQLLIGCLVAVVLQEINVRIPAIWALGACVPLVAFAVVPGVFPDLFYARGGSVLVALAAGFIVAHAATSGKSWTSRVLATAPMVWVGQRSYGIYLWNLPIISLMAFTGSGVAAILGKLLLCFLIPALSYRYIEQPFLRLKKHFTGGQRQTSAVGAASSYARRPMRMKVHLRDQA